jgi:hypothetical protein
LKIADFLWPRSNGIVEVAFFAASAAGGPPLATIAAAEAAVDIPKASIFLYNF